MSIIIYIGKRGIETSPDSILRKVENGTMIMFIAQVYFLYKVKAEKLWNGCKQGNKRLRQREEKSWKESQSWQFLRNKRHCLRD